MAELDFLVCRGDVAVDLLLSSILNPTLITTRG